MNALIYGGLPGNLIRLERTRLDPNDFLREPGWDWNQNERALEIVNDQLLPVFQLMFDQPSHIVVNGVFPINPHELMVADRCFHAPDVPGSIRFVPVPDLPSVVRMPTLSCKRIFKYAAWRYPGTYE